MVVIFQNRLEVIPLNCIAHPYCALLLASFCGLTKNMAVFSENKFAGEINAHFLLNEHGDPTFLMRKFKFVWLATMYHDLRKS